MGAEDDSSADDPAKDTGTEKIMNWMISKPEAAAAAVECRLQSCICGWANVTSTKGLKIHQGKKGCQKNGATGILDQKLLSEKKVESVISVQQ